ncbi:MAG: YeeE/YedE thiosulfate transporter family protein [Lutibacter sp.]|nr:YeeE/YedE thiosulfate transporter family protein [Lutibacter sp.]MDP3945540.1 YeeE/YedE thiosulfate transporter family protein [Lutibacter sp.]
MKYIKFFLVGILFGIVMSKAEIISWYRIYEMFKFQSFHMYGIIGSAIVLGMISMFLFKKKMVKTFKGDDIHVMPKKEGLSRNLLGGILFGLGWALAGACPGPMFVLIGKGVVSILVVIFGATLGAFFYGLFKDKLPN